MLEEVQSILTNVMQYPHGLIAQYAATVKTRRKSGDADCMRDIDWTQDSKSR